MPEIKNNFIKGRMNKDLDERLVPNGEYRDAMNIQVSTSEEDSVGTVQNVLGNIRVGHQLPNLTCVGSVADEKNNHVYYLATTSIGNVKSYIFRYSIDTAVHEIVFRDLKDVLKFRPQNILTGINIIDDMMFFTDNFSEPKKINIPRSITGTDQSDDSIHTKLVVNGTIFGDIEESHVTVIKKAPNYAPELEMISDIPEGNISGLLPSANQVLVGTTFEPDMSFNFDTYDVGDIFYFIPDLPPGSNGLIYNINVGDEVVFEEYEQNIPAIPLQNFLIRGIVVAKNENPNDPATGNPVVGVTQFGVRIITKSIDTPIGLDEDNRLPTYAMSLFVDPKGMFEFKFPRFSTRYKYEDGEYSTFGPFTEIAFIPSDFDYEPKKGYNVGMTNKLKELYLKQFVPKDIPEDVVSIDLLYKESDSVAVYVLASLSANDPAITADPYNGLNEYTFVNSIEVPTDIGPQTRDIGRNGRYQVKSETLYALVNQNQLLRPFDNVPRKALAQEVSGSRIIYGNYLQNYNIPKYNDKLIIQTNNFTDVVTEGKTYKSIKSLREYQLGVVYLDEYGRQSPVLTDSRASISLDKSYSARSNRLYARIKGSAPSWARSFKFYIKETSGEFYNLAMDRFYDAKDGNIWLAFPSSDRNKVDIDTFLILKKGADSDFAITNLARYKILAIENNAPDYIKTVYKALGQSIHDTSVTAGVQQDLFGTVDSFVGDSEFVIQADTNSEYIFRDTSLFNIYKQIEDTKIRVRFEDLDSGSQSKSYVVNNIGYDPDADGVPLGTLTVRVDDDFGTDTEFLTLDQSTGLHNNFVKDRVRIVFEEIAVENAAKFDGRFFVKIYNNETTRNQIGSREASDTQKYRRLASRKVYYLADNNVDLHSYSGAGQYPGSNDPFSAPTQSPTGGGSSSPIDYHSQGILAPSTLNNVVYGFLTNSDHQRSFYYKYNAFFRSDISYSIADRSNATSSSFEDVWYIDGNTPHKVITGGNPNVIGTDHTGANAGINSEDPSNVSGAVPIQGSTPGIGDTGGTNAQGIIELGFGGLEPGNPRPGTNFTVAYDYFEDLGSQNVGNSGLDITEGTGGARPQNSVEGFGVSGGQAIGWTKGVSTIFNIAQSDINNQYGVEADFVDQLVIGAKLRWKEDSNTPQNVYTVADIIPYYVIRYEEPHFKYKDSSGTTYGRRWFGNFNTPGVFGPNQNYFSGNFETDTHGQQMVYNNQGEPAFALRPENYQVRFKIFLDRPLVWNPLDGSTLGPNQDEMNGFSPNSVEAFAKIGTTVTAQGYTLEIVEDDNDPNLKVSTNPAIWETEPKETVDLDVYYEASDRSPVTLNEKNIVDLLKIGSKVRDINNSGDPANNFVTSNEYIIDGHVENNTLILNRPTGGTHFDTATGPYSSYPQTPAVIIEITTPEDSRYQFSVLGIVPATNGNQIVISTNMHNSSFDLNWYNCYSFGNGVESNRIEDNFNRVFIDKGAVASTTLEEGLYKQERRKYGLIFSGLYNSTSGVNNLNQFIQAENITKDVNPNYGSIQKLFSRQSDLIALCEDKILKILANKDAVFNADGNPQLTANQNVLGQTIPFVGDYGISKNPESFASESYRAYFTDKQRGAVLRLSMDGLTPISDAGMSDWFGDNLEPATFLIGSYDQDKSKYNLVINKGNYFGTRHILQGKTYTLYNYDIGAYCLSFSERNKGWVTFNSFIYESAVSAANKYFTFKYGNIYEHHVNTSDRNTFYPTSFDYGTGAVDSDGIYTNSNVKFIFNQEPNIIKEFRALNYEGSKSRLLDQYSDNSYKNLNDQEGWFASNISTNLEEGVVPYFVEKESKWFNYIKGNSISFLNNTKNIDSTKFSVQGIGIVDTVAFTNPVYGCTDNGSNPNFPNRPLGFIGPADNYDPNANTDDGSCAWTVVMGCTDPNAINYDPNANVDDGSCIAPVYGCTDGTGVNNPYTPSTGPATNYNPAANVDDGSCVYNPPAPIPPPLQGAVIINSFDPSITIDYFDNAGNVVGSNQGTALALPNSGPGNLFNATLVQGPTHDSIQWEFNLEVLPAYGGVPPYTYTWYIGAMYIEDTYNPDPAIAENSGIYQSQTPTIIPFNGAYPGEPNLYYGIGTQPSTGSYVMANGVHPVSGNGNLVGVTGSHTPGQPGQMINISWSFGSTQYYPNFELVGGTSVEKIALYLYVVTTDSAGTFVPQSVPGPAQGLYGGQYIAGATNGGFDIPSSTSVTNPVYGYSSTPLTPGAWTHSSTTNTFNSVSANVNFAAATGGTAPYTYSNLGYREVDTATGGVIPGQLGTFNVIGGGNPYFSLSNYSWGSINWPSQGQGNPNEMYVEFTVDITDSAGTTITSTDIQTYNRPLYIGPQPFTGTTSYNISSDIDFYSLSIAQLPDYNNPNINHTLYTGSGPYTHAEAVHYQNEATNLGFTVDMIGVIDMNIIYGNPAQNAPTPPVTYNFRTYYKPGGAIDTLGNTFTFWQNSTTFSGQYPHGPFAQVMTFNGSGNYYIDDLDGTNGPLTDPFYSTPSLVTTGYNFVSDGVSGGNYGGVIVDTQFLHSNNIYGLHLYDSNNGSNGGFGAGLSGTNGDELILNTWMDTQDVNAVTANPEQNEITIDLN